MEDFDFTVEELMKEFGFVATYVKQEVGEYDPSIGESTVTTTEIPVEAILLDLTLQSNGLSVKYGTLIQAGDKELYIRPPEKVDDVDSLVIDPSSDVIKVGNITYKIVSVKELNTTGSNPILYSLYVRR